MKQNKVDLAIKLSNMNFEEKFSRLVELTMQLIIAESIKTSFRASDHAEIKLLLNEFADFKEIEFIEKFNSTILQKINQN